MHKVNVVKLMELGFKLLEIGRARTEFGPINHMIDTHAVQIT